MLQNASFTLPELHVDTEQRKNLAPTAMGLRHMQQAALGSDIERG